VHRSEWVEWLDRLTIPGDVAFGANGDPVQLVGIQYVPLEDVVEVVVDRHAERVLVTLDAPREIWVEAEGTDHQRIVFECLGGSIELAASENGGATVRPFAPLDPAA
jgi:hypothetical protein